MLNLIITLKNNIIVDDWNIIKKQENIMNLTLGNTIVIDTLTLNQIGHILPKRKTILVSTTKKIINKDCLTVKSLEDVAKLNKKEKDIFVIGNAQNYKYILDNVDKIYLSILDTEINMNALTRIIDENTFNRINADYLKNEDTGFYIVYERTKKRS